MKDKSFGYSLILIVSLITNGALAQSTTNNYVKAYKAQLPIVGDLSIYENKDSVTTSIAYYDGLGREIQSVSRQGSPEGKDMINFSTYDGYGRKAVSYLPYAVTNINATTPVVDPLADQKTFYVGLFGTNDGQAALSETVIEHSELGRVIEQAAPGYNWRLGSTHTIKKEYRSNIASDSVLLIKYNATTGISVTPGVASFYSDYSLTCTKTIDEQGNDVVEFVDKEGRLICKKVRASAVAYSSTYYVYDKFGNLATVVPPEGVRSIRKLLNLN